VTYYPEDHGGRGTVYGGAQRPDGAVYGGPEQGRPARRPPLQRPVKPRRSRFARVFLTLFIVLLVLGVGAAATAAYVIQQADSNIQRVGDVFGQLPERPAAGAGGTKNILLVGSDSARKGSPRSDTIMVLHLPDDRSGAYVVSIPRDSWVDVPGRGKAKINAAYAWGGAPLLAQTVENLSGVRLDHYMQIDFDGFEQMTDALGGIDMPGAGHLDGKAALKYVRERKSLPRGDFDRIVRQQKFLAALMSKASNSTGDPAALMDLVDAVSKAVRVDSDFSTMDLTSLAFGMRNVRGDTMHFATVPNQGSGWAGGQSVVFLDKPAAATLWTAVRDDQMAPWTAAQPSKK
jgi:anionic cell wall polymer biosynthesis LytR-Cps2A-Psr (LCP) family protein